jgi:transaldolase/glucose-6-phosphate isomerase
VAILAYLDKSRENEDALQEIREVIRASRRVATCLGFGPRFLHSTGQAYKGGPNSGIFLQITSGHESDLSIPGHAYTFGQVQAAQARGDLQVLAARNRRYLRVHFSKDVAAGLRELREAIRSALHLKSAHGVAA